MPLSERQRHQLSIQFMQQYYPHATGEQVGRVRAICVRQFVGNYSPLPKEQDSSGAAG